MFLLRKWLNRSCRFKIINGQILKYKIEEKYEEPIKVKENATQLLKMDLEIVAPYRSGLIPLLV